MQRRRLGGLEVSAVGLGCATMTPFYDEPDRDAAVETLRRAREIGVDFIDSSDAYGQGRNEELIAHAVKGHRDEYVIASKFGNLRAPDGSPASDGRPEYVKACCERSLKRLETDVIDLYYIHRVDPTVPIEDTVGAMSDLVRQGKVRYLGICEAGAATIRRAHATHPLSAVQIGVFAVDPRCRSRDPAALCGARHRLCRLQPARPRFPDRQGRRYRGAPGG
jgi:aryl-alcohol dehydrogenase-like predicted oxidoreductase